MIAEGRGATITDVDGNTFLDFTGGVGCLNVGHSHPRVVEAAQAQLERFSHTDFTIVPYEVYVELAERLTELAPVRKPAKAAFFNAGTEAVENAVKFARAYTKRPAVIAFEGAFHGRTMLSLTLTSKTHPYKAGLGPFAPEIYRVPFAQEYRGPSTDEALSALERAFTTQVDPEHVAAIVVEPVQGEGGFHPGAAGFPRRAAADLRRARDRPRRRRGADRLRAHRADVRDGALRHRGRPDDGREVDRRRAAALGRDRTRAEIMDAPGDSAIGGTYVGNPVAQAAALAVLDVIEEENLVERAAQIGETMRTRMLAWQERFPAIGDVRGLGAMLAIELVEDREHEAPGARRSRPPSSSEAAQRGLLLLKAGIYSNCIRVLCPLTLTDEELDEALSVWEEALEAALGT